MSRHRRHVEEVQWTGSSLHFLCMRISHQCTAYMDCKWMDESIEFMTNGFKTIMDLQLDPKQQWVALK
jgi:hypothetical protein